MHTDKKNRLIMKNRFTLITIFLLLLCYGNAYSDIAFVANVNGNWELFLADDNGKNPAQLTNTLYDEKDPCWSWDKKRIVYATSDGNLNIVDIDSRETFQIAVGKKKTPKITPCFSPDGDKLAFVSTRSGIMEIWIKDMKSGKVRRLRPFGESVVECKDVAW